MPSHSIPETRRANLKLLIAQWGGATRLAKKLKHSGPSYLSQFVHERRPITEKTARHIEQVLGLVQGWLDEQHRIGEEPPDAPLCTQVVLLVGAALEQAGLQVTPAKFAELVALAYDEATRRGELGEPLVKRIVALLR